MAHIAIKSRRIQDSVRKPVESSGCWNWACTHLRTLKRKPLWSRFLVVVAAISFQTQLASAEVKIGFRQLSSTKPVAVQQGTTSIVKLHSNFTLDETYAVFFDKPGIKMTFEETKPIAAPRSGRGRLGKPFRFKSR